MWLYRTGIAGVAAALLWSSPVFAEAPSSTSALARMTQSGWLQFEVVSGRIVLSGSRSGSISTGSSSSGSNEKLSIRFSNSQRSLSYERSTPKEQLVVEITSSSRVSIRRNGKDDADVVPVHFTQVPDEPISLALGADERVAVYRAPTLWHLLIMQPEECQEHLLPLLQLLRPDWQLAETAAAMETALLRAASVGHLPDRTRWNRLVEQLADQRFARREAADRELRSAGPVVLGYLRELDFSRLDAEQQFRVRRIIRSLSTQAGGDTAEQFVAQLVSDPEIWLAMLSRREQSTRRLAARQLGVILDRTVPFDPTADPATRQEQIEQLRARIRGKYAEAGP